MRLLPLLEVLVLLLAVAVVPAARAGDEAPPPARFDRVDYANPRTHLGLSPHVGDEGKIRALASQLAVDRPARTLGRIHQWLHRNLRYDEQAAYQWRSLDEMLKDRTYGGCADHAAVFGTLARAAGIPTIWVKTMDVDWIEDFREGRDAHEEYRGHVFLEVFLDGRWQLLDAQAMRLYPHYDPVTTRILPGNRFAYDKGDDPYALVLSCRWDLWKKQTHDYFSKLDPAELPWGRYHDLLAPWRVWIAGNAPFYRHAAEICRRRGYLVEKTFNRNWEKYLAQARGSILVVTCQGRRPVLPERYWDTLLPPGYRDVVEGRSLPESGFLHRRLDDGTWVILAPGQDAPSLQIGVSRALDAIRS